MSQNVLSAAVVIGSLKVLRVRNQVYVLHEGFGYVIIGIV